MSMSEDVTPKRVEVARKGLAVSRADFILVTLFVLAGAFGSFLIDRAVGWVGRGFEPRESRTRLRYDVPWKQDALAMTRKEQTATEDQLIKARLELYQQEAALAALDAAPAPQPLRVEVSVKRAAAARATDALVHRLAVLQQAVNSLRREVEEGEQLAARDFGFRHVTYKAARAVAVFGLTLLLLFVVYRLLKWLRLLTRYEEAARAGDGLFLLKAVGGLLVVLIAYQAFQVAGAALAAAVVLLLFLKGFYGVLKAGTAAGGTA